MSNPILDSPLENFTIIRKANTIRRLLRYGLHFLVITIAYALCFTFITTEAFGEGEF